MTHPNASVLQLVEQGDAAYKAKDYDAAKRLYDQALDLAVRTGAETNYIYSSLAKVYKKLNMYREAYEISRQAVPTPGGFRDCAICLRQLAKQAKKSSDIPLLKKTLMEFYRLAVLAYLCYGTHDCKTGVAGYLYDRALILSRKIELRQIHATFEKHGKFAGGGLLTENDYKLFSSVFGETDRTYNPHNDFSVLMSMVNDEYLKWLREHCLAPPPGHPEYRNDPFWIRNGEESFNRIVQSMREKAPFSING